MDVHPAIWEGSLDGWLAACDFMLGLDIDVVVPGHGPLTDKAGVRMFKTYLETLRREARLRFEAGMAVEEAADDIVFDPPYDSWLRQEEHTYELQPLMRISSAVFCLKKKKIRRSPTKRKG